MPVNYVNNFYVTSSNSTRTGKFSVFLASTNHLFKIFHPPILMNLQNKGKNIEREKLKKLAIREKFVKFPGDIGEDHGGSWVQIQSGAQIFPSLHFS